MENDHYPPNPGSGETELRARLSGMLDPVACLGVDFGSCGLGLGKMCCKSQTLGDEMMRESKSAELIIY